MAGIVYEDVTFDTTDGVQLHGWFMPFQDQEGEAFDDPGPVVILPSDGNDNMGSVLWHYFHFFRGTPWHVLAFDWRGFGKSGAWEIDTTSVVIPELVTDLEAAINYAKGRPEFNGNLGVMAWGPAGAVAMAAAAGRDDVGAIAVRGIYTTQAEYCARLTLDTGESRWLPNPAWPSDEEPIAIAPKLEVPVFVVVGENDTVTPPAMAEAVHDSLAGPKKLWVAPGASVVPEAMHVMPFAIKLHEFFRAHLGTGGF
jgi:pimeloyl-ACP methyl ester carboxylesterase